VAQAARRHSARQRLLPVWGWAAGGGRGERVRDGRQGEPGCRQHWPARTGEHHQLADSSVMADQVDGGAASRRGRQAVPPEEEPVGESSLLVEVWQVVGVGRLVGPADVSDDGLTC